MKKSNIQFSDAILQKIDLIDSAFSELGVPLFFQNEDISIDWGETDSHCIKFMINRDSNQSCIPLEITLTDYRIRMDMFELKEVFEWSKEYLETSKGEFRVFLTELFSSYILFEFNNNPNYKSSILLFDKNGVMTNKYVLRGLNLFNFRETNKSLFFPIYCSK